MSVTVEDIFKKIDELDTFLIEAGCERNGDIELVSYFKNGSGEDTEVKMFVSQPNYNIRRDDNDD
jgi:hypothetical protein